VFENCISLKQVTIQNGVEKIGRYAFRGCINLLDVVFPSTLLTIEENAFEDCDSLHTVIIPDGVTSIKENAFNSCDNIYIIRIPDTINEIYNCAFGYKNVYYAGSKSQWGNIAVKDINALKYLNSLPVTFDADVVEYVNTGKMEYVLINNTYVLKFKNLDNSIKSFDFEKELPDYEIISLQEGAFENCRNLSSIILPDTIVEMGESAFKDCISLTSIKLPNSIKEISSYLLRGCNLLKEVIIPNGVEVIKNEALHTEGLNVIYIPSTVKVIENGGIGWRRQECTVYYDGSDINEIDIKYDYLIDAKYFENINSVKYIETDKYIYDLIDGNKVYNLYVLDETLISFDFDKIFLDYELISLRRYAFEKCYQLTNLTLPNTLQIIENHAFSNTQIKTIVIPDSVTFLAKDVFGNSSINAVALGNGVKQIDNFFDWDAANIYSLYIPRSVVSIVNSSLKNLPQDANVYYAGSEEEWNKFNLRTNANVVFEVEEFEFVENEKYLFDLVDGNQVYNFRNLDKKIRTFDFDTLYPDYELIEIGTEAFNNCILLRDVSLSDTLKRIKSKAFYCCEKIATITLPVNLEYIGTEAFYNTKISYLDIPDSVKVIGNNAFAANYSLREIHLSSSMTVLNDIFENSVKFIYVPNSIKEIDYNVFIDVSDTALILYEGTKN
jgi:hypothetical protein